MRVSVPFIDDDLLRLADQLFSMKLLNLLYLSIYLSVLVSHASAEVRKYVYFMYNVQCTCNYTLDILNLHEILYKLEELKSFICNLNFLGLHIVLFEMVFFCMGVYTRVIRASILFYITKNIYNKFLDQILYAPLLFGTFLHYFLKQAAILACYLVWYLLAAKQLLL